MGPLWGIYATERWSASQGTMIEGLGEKKWIDKEIVAMLAKTIVLSGW